MRIGGSAGLAAACLVALAGGSPGCADYNANASATRSIYSVRVVKSKAEIGDCRPLGLVDSRDEARGCGRTVQPTPEECLRFQVRRAGGDTLVINGPIGEAYDCSGGPAPAPVATPPPTAAPAPVPRATPPPPPSATPAAPPPTAIPATPTPAIASAPEEKRARVVRDRGAARGCVYVGDLDPKTVCPGATGSDTEDCLSRRGAEAGADTVVWEGGTAQLFSCNAAR